MNGDAWLELGRAVLLAAAGAADDDAGDSRASRVDDARVSFELDLGGDGAFAALADNAGLTVEEAEVLAVLVAAETSPVLQRVVAELHDDPACSRISLGLLAALAGAGHIGPLAVGPGSRLRVAELVAVDATGPWSQHAVTVHPSIVWALVGDPSPDPDLPADVAWLDIDPGDDDRHDRAGADRAGADLVVATGADRMRRRSLGAAVALGDRFLCLAAPATPEAWAAVVREATITGRGVIVEIDDRVPPELRRTVERASHLVWVVSARHAPPIDDLPDRAWREVDAAEGIATPDEWSAVLGEDVDPVHRLTLDQLHRVARVRHALDGDLDAAVRRLAAGSLEHVTRRIRPTRRWDDIVLSADRHELLRAIVDRARHARRVYDDWGYPATPSQGVVALFSGPSGTGKTLAAEIIAGELGLDLFKLDLSAVVSKYIGETEKNLDQIFDAASAGNAVLFFDEADSLFGKRSEVKDARDRYANIEVSYLLQRLEAHDGLVVMATNFEKNVDEAFVRRIHVRIEFALPGVDERRLIWTRSFPAGAPLGDDVDIDWLASRFELAGGAIRNAALNAAFVAAARSSDITMEAVIVGLAREYRKLGRLINAKDFGEYHALLGPTG